MEPEFEVGELRRQRRRVVIEQLELEIHAPVGHRHSLDQLAMPLMNVGWLTSSRCTGAPMPSKNASQSKPGASFWYSGNVIGL